MTNTLHRFGKPESFKDDFIVFIMSSRGINDKGAPEKVRAFLKAAVKYNPVNIGDALIGSMYQPDKDLSFTKLYLTGRKEQITAGEAIEAFDKSGSATVVFDNKEALEGFLKEVNGLDLGLSVNVSALAEKVKVACRNSDIIIHSVEYSLGFQGDLYRLPERQVLALTTMCGHGMISANFARKLIDRIKEARITPEKAAGYMAKFCVCGAFNTTRAIRILNEVRMAD
ncbi:MAG: hypothetical protein JRJ02_05670 [Deltaproteobacteria bacterium]|nr:hypothetical protein [Deltaproteobacteria bacterium]MBW1861845.1 hypothetical protein [Deltaproteobacteria bacterium]